jgi:glutamate-5-semialdehyde dehydrogenase
MLSLEEIGKNAKLAAAELAIAGTTAKNNALVNIANALCANAPLIIEANKKDIECARQNGISESIIDRLTLDEKRIKSTADGVLQVAALEDPIGKSDCGWTRPNGLRICKTRVPLGVIGIIFEARPNVTVDAASLTLKSGNACILRGGKEAINSNLCIAAIMRKAIALSGLPADCVQVISDTSRETATQLMRLNKYLDVLIPRGGQGLIRSVVEHSTVPVIETGVGNCHIYVDETANLDMGAEIIFNAKTQRPSVCNAAETLLVNEKIAAQFLPKAKALLDKKDVELRGCAKTAAILGASVKPATEEDYATEFLDYILSVKVVADVDEAIQHINHYGSRHSEAIITENYSNAEKFMQRVDAAAVYVNASTRFTDGNEFGFGAEIGISTQKLHARGPMGLNELTTIKYLIYGSGQIRK